MMLRSATLCLVAFCGIAYRFPSHHRHTSSCNSFFSIDSSSSPRTSFDESEVLNYKYASTGAEDDALYKQFVSQLSELTYGSPEKLTLPSKKKMMMSSRSITTKKVVETPTFLMEGQPLEIIHKKKLIFGNFIEYKDSGSAHSIVVRLQTDEMVTIDVSQVISIWDILADESPPLRQEDWAAVTADALEILGKMSPRKSDLDQFWKAVVQRRAEIPIDSMDLGVYVFQEYAFRKWLDPNLEGSDCNVQALSAAQRYAASLLLFFDDFHFKRRPSIHVAGVSNRGTCVEGGYKPLDESVVLHKHGEAFLKYYTKIIESSSESSTTTSTSTTKPTTTTNASSVSPYYNACVLRQLRALENYAVAPNRGVPPAAAVRHLLKRMQLPLTPLGAKELLLRMQRQRHTISIASSTTTTNSKIINNKQSDNNGSIDNSASNSNNKSALNKSNNNSNRQYTEITPWPEGVVDSAFSLAESIRNRRVILTQTEAPVRAGKKGSLGRLDFRNAASDHPVLCLDSRRASFFDDGFSLSPETGEILIHIADVTEALRKYPLLLSTAKERVASVFTPQGPLHMLPPQALDALRLTPDGPNEAITVGISVEFETGRLIGSRVFPSIIGPVATLDIAMADELLAAADSGSSTTLRAPAGYSAAAVKDLVLTHQLMERVVKAQPWVDAHYSLTSGGSGRETIMDKRTGVYSYAGQASRTPASRMVNALLTLYSNSSAMFCQMNGLPYPVAWENKDRVTPSVVRRFATQPLRNWLSQMQQTQLRAALKMNNALTQSDCALAVTHVNGRRQQQQSLKLQSTQQSSFEAFVSHCEAYLLSTGNELDLMGEVIQGQFTTNSSSQTNSNSNIYVHNSNSAVTIRLKEFGVQGILAPTTFTTTGNSNTANTSNNINELKKGDLVKVKVKKIIFDNNLIILDLLQ